MEKEMANDQNVAAELDKLQNMYETTQSKKFESLPPNNYIATVTNLKIMKSSTNKLQAMITYSVIEGDYEGKPVNSFYTIGDEEGFAYFKGWCEIVGMALPAKFSDIQAAANDFIAAFNGKLKITVKEGKKKNPTTGALESTGFNNVYCNGFHEENITA